MKEAANRSRLHMSTNAKATPITTSAHDVFGLGLGSRGAEVFHDAMSLTAKGASTLKYQSEQLFRIAGTELLIRMERSQNRALT